MPNLANMVTLITGSSAGIGAGIAIHFAHLGAKLSLTGRDQAKLDAVARKCEEAGLGKKDIFLLAGDVTDEEHRKLLIEKTVQHFGHLDILVNNAGTIVFEDIKNTTLEKYDWLMNVNVRSVYILTKLAIPYLVKTKGCIVNVSSVCGKRVVSQIPVYCMSKAALDMFTKTLAIELAPSGVRVNSVNPATVVSELLQRNTGYSDEQIAQMRSDSAKVHPLGRIGQPEDVAAAVAFLASNDASFITGELVFIDGGRTCQMPIIPLRK